ncbi:MAG TPA: AraC family transcriptional regulator [Pseudoxanthomonas sp.]
MDLRHHVIHFGDCLDLGQHADDRLHLIRASGRGMQVDVPPGWVSIWLPLSGQLSLESAGCEWELGTRHTQVWRESRLQCRSRTSCWWLGLAGSARAWTQALHRQTSRQHEELFPWQGRISRDAARLLVRLAHQGQRAPRETAREPDPLLRALWSCLTEQQQDLHACLQRCTGRTHDRRQQTLLRLLRVQHQIRCNPDIRLDLESLARTASYSPCHLIRVYRSVFDETPFEYAVRLREQRAWRMVSGTGLPICEITEMLGFESQSAFCRAFKNTFGATTSEVRRASAFTPQRRAA